MSTTVAPTRDTSVDLLRGLVVVLMALDHARDFFGVHAHPPEDLSEASAALFLTRWVTHFCAPVFVFLAGVGAGLSLEAGRSPAEVSRYLWTRGLWLIVLELTVVNVSWLSWFAGWFFIQVIWILGLSMLFLAPWVRAPRALAATVGIAMLVGHNLLDGVSTSGILWKVLHEPGFVGVGGGWWMAIVYPLLPWPGLMLLGWSVAPLWTRSPEQRRRYLANAGLALVVAFLAVRLANGYGNPSPWEIQERGGAFTALSFLNTTKYPPSLAFLLMTVGPACLLLAFWTGRRLSPFGRWLLDFGRTPLFFYLLHIPVLHAGAWLWSGLVHDTGGWWLGPPSAWPEGYTPQLWRAYAAWLACIAVLWPACRWFAAVKRRRKDGWLRYL